ncbi:hypothetical protein [Leptothoe sp. PORK10 BA2]|uniref:hypothetical protein n=1 Tax=Leptothoe sp. PORK10 BA2 TaxID=3110254 RepID=UPI002B1F5FCF|nr:hypothetical protein [Leptothoe sp. PORK10 BA2]MEA5464632.1 hypothetical protein [Leptothoe sp. PORK10 BA2]
MARNSIRKLLGNIKNIFSDTAVIWLLALFIFVFVFGWWMGSISPNLQLSTQQTILLTVILPALLAIVTTLTTFVINNAAEKKAEEKLSEKDSVIDELNQTVRRRSDILVNIKEFIDKNAAKLQDDNLIDYRNELSAEILALEAEADAATKISDWLSESQNHRDLTLYACRQALNRTVQSSTVTPEIIDMFKQDIYNCITWLTLSLLQGAPHYVNVSKLARSEQGLPENLENHRQALLAVEEYSEIATRLGRTKKFRELRVILISRLEIGIRQKTFNKFDAIT